MVDRLVAVDDADYRLPDPVLQAIAADVVNVGTDVGSALSTTFTAQSALPVNLLKYATTFPSSQSAAIQAAVDATPVGGTLEIPAGMQFRSDTTVNVNHAMTISSPGRGGFYSGLTGTAAHTMLNVTASDVRIDNVKLKGPQFASVANQYGIKFTGTVGTYVSRPVVVNCDISNFAFFGIHGEFVRDIKFDDNQVYDIAYGAIMVLSADSGSIDKNNIRNITKGGYADAYGISATRAYGSLATVPRSKNLSISRNRIADVPAWAGVDSHAGQNIKIDNNIITNTYFPISCVSSKLVGAGAYDLACLDVSITNNQCDSTVTDGTRSSLNLVGNSVEKATGEIRGNRVRGHGLQANSQGGGIQIDYTQGVIVAHNTCVESGLSGIIIVSNNDGFIIESNVIIDPWSESVNIVKGVWSLGDYNKGSISANRLLIGSKTATKTLANGLGIAISTQANTSIMLGINESSVAATPLWDTGAKAKVGLFGVAPVGRAAAITAPPSPSATYDQAEMVALRAAVVANTAAIKNVGVTN